MNYIRRQVHNLQASYYLILTQVSMYILQQKKKILHEIGWYSSYLLDKRVLNSKESYEKSNKSLDELSRMVSESYLIEFSWLNISPNHKMFKREGQKYELTPFSLCSCFNCKSMSRCL